MSGYVYLIRIGDLYRIGKTDNLEKKIRKLKPDELLTSIMTKEPETLEAVSYTHLTLPTRRGV